MAQDESLQGTIKDMLHWIANSADHLAVLARMDAPRDSMEGELARLGRRLRILQTLEGDIPEAAELARQKHWSTGNVEHRLANEAQAAWGMTVLKKKLGLDQKHSWWLRWWR